MKAGDIILVSGRGWRARWIKRFTQSPGEAPTRYSHVAIAVSATHVVEALWSGVVLRPKQAGQVFRPKNLTPQDKKLIVDKAMSYVGKPYGWGKVVLHALGLRRFCTVDGWPHCAWVVASAYAATGYHFGVPYQTATPDDIADFVTQRKDKYEEVDSPVRF